MPGERPHLYTPEHSRNSRIVNKGIMLPGQDSRKPGMFTELLQHESSATIIHEGNDLLKKEFGYDLLDLASEGTTKEETDKKADTLRHPIYTIPSVALLGWGVQTMGKYQLKLDGFANRPRFLAGVSMGMGVALGIAGAHDRQRNLLFHGERGMIMEEGLKSQPKSSMEAVLTDETGFMKFMADHPRDIDLCLVNGPQVWVIGGQDDGPNSPMAKARKELDERGIKRTGVDTYAAMHGRFLTDSQAKFDKLVDKTPFEEELHVDAVSSQTGTPFRSARRGKDELKRGYSHMVDNARILRFYDATGVEVITDISTAGNVAKTAERAHGAISHKRLKRVGVGAGAVGAVGVVAAGATFLIHEAVTVYHELHPAHPKNKDAKED